MVEGGRTPVLSKAELEEIGYGIAIFPALGFLAAGEAMRSAFTTLKDQGSSDKMNTPLYPFEAFSALMGFGAVTAFDKKYREVA